MGFKDSVDLLSQNRFTDNTVYGSQRLRRCVSEYGFESKRYMAVKDSVSPKVHLAKGFTWYMVVQRLYMCLSGSQGKYMY